MRGKERWKTLTPGGKIDSSWFMYCWCLKLNDERMGGIGGSAVGGDNLRKFSSCGRHTSKFTMFSIVRNTSKASCGCTTAREREWERKEIFIFNLWLCVLSFAFGTRKCFYWKCVEIAVKKIFMNSWVTFRKTDFMWLAVKKLLRSLLCIKEWRKLSLYCYNGKMMWWNFF